MRSLLAAGLLLAGEGPAAADHRNALQNFERAMRRELALHGRGPRRGVPPGVRRAAWWQDPY
jgi:hypothetical protein